MQPKTIFVSEYDNCDWEELFKSDPWRDSLSEEDWLLIPDDLEDKAEVRCN